MEPVPVALYSGQPGIPGGRLEPWLARRVQRVRRGPRLRPCGASPAGPATESHRPSPARPESPVQSGRLRRRDRWPNKASRAGQRSSGGMDWPKGLLSKPWWASTLEQARMRQRVASARMDSGRYGSPEAAPLVRERPLVRPRARPRTRPRMDSSDLGSPERLPHSSVFGLVRSGVVWCG